MDPCTDSQKAPILAQQCVEYEQLQSKSAQLASQLANALTEHDSSVSTATDISQCLTKTHYENELLQKQLNDLGQQVQTLLKEHLDNVSSQAAYIRQAMDLSVSTPSKGKTARHRW